MKHRQGGTQSGFQERRFCYATAATTYDNGHYYYREHVYYCRYAAATANYYCYYFGHYRLLMLGLVPVSYTHLRAHET